MKGYEKIARDYYTREKFQATLHFYVGGFMVIDWLPAGKTWHNLWLRIFIDENRGYVAITGDADDETLCWYHAEKADNLADYLMNFSYSLKKIQSSENNLYTYNPEDIKADLMRFFQNHDIKIEGCRDYYDLCDIIESEYIPPEAVEILSEIDEEWYEYEFGKRVSPHFFYRHVGASMAIREVMKKLGYSEELSENV